MYRRLHVRERDLRVRERSVFVRRAGARWLLPRGRPMPSGRHLDGNGNCRPPLNLGDPCTTLGDPYPLECYSQWHTALHHGRTAR
jgi:hypothetical protein